MWIFPSLIDNSLNVSWRAPAGAVIGVVKANDSDAPAGHVRYSIVAQSGPGVSTSSEHLLLNENTGELVVQHEFSFSNVGFHSLQLLARDRGEPQRSTGALLRLFVTDTPHTRQHIPGAVSGSWTDPRADPNRAFNGDSDAARDEVRRQRDWRSGRTERVEKSSDVILFGLRLDSAAQQVCKATNFEINVLIEPYF